MAAAIARHLAGASGPEAGRIESAGISASEGDDATPEARQALQAMGIDLGPHRSRAITPDLIEEADEIICMTPDHLRAILRLVPEARGKTTTLARQPIPDPIGGPLERYLDTASAIKRLIERRMQEARL